MLEQVGEAGATGPLVLRTDVIPDLHVHDRRRVVLEQDNGEAIRQRGQLVVLRGLTAAESGRIAAARTAAASTMAHAAREERMPGLLHIAPTRQARVRARRPRRVTTEDTKDTEAPTLTLARLCVLCGSVVENGGRRDRDPIVPRGVVRPRAWPSIAQRLLQLREPAEYDGRLQPLAVRDGGIAGDERAGVHRVRDAGLSGSGDAVANLEMAGHADLAGKDHVVANHGAAGNPDLGAEQRVPADADAVRHLNEIVDPRPPKSAFLRRPGDRPWSWRRSRRRPR